MMRPGTYLRLRREAARLSIDDVAAMVSTDPRLAAIDRVDWLTRIEADVATLTPDVIDALAQAFPISRYVLLRLLDLYGPGDLGVAMPEICTDCGCSEFDPCIHHVSGAACAWAWAQSSLCTTCAARRESTPATNQQETARAA